LSQPVVRAWNRYLYRLSNKRLPHIDAPEALVRACTKSISFRTKDIYWDSHDYRGRDELLNAVVTNARRVGWNGDFHSEWAAHDVELLGGLWHNIRITTATEELGWPRRFTRARCRLRLTGFACSVIVVSALLVVAAIAARQPVVIGICAFVALVVLIALVRSGRRCLCTTARLLYQAGQAAGLDAIPLVKIREKARPQPKPREHHAAESHRTAWVP
jgi:hypothetical protein